VRKGFTPCDPARVTKGKRTVWASREAGCGFKSKAGDEKERVLFTLLSLVRKKPKGGVAPRK